MDMASGPCGDVPPERLEGERRVRVQLAAAQQRHQPDDAREVGAVRAGELRVPN